MAKRIGVKDIAAKAGVSIGTVDRVLHNRGEVKKETKEKVLAIVDELGYEPNVFAKSLSSKKTTRIAIIIPDSRDNNPYWEKPAAGIKKATEELLQYNVEVLFEFFDASDEDSFKKVLESVTSLNPDGVVLNPVFKSVSLNYLSIFKQKKIPYVFIDVNIKGVNKLGYFGQDAEQSGVVAAKLMRSYLFNTASVLVVKLSKNKVFSQHINSRVIGFQKCYTSDEAKNITVLEIDLNRTDEPQKSLTAVFSGKNAFDGIFVPNTRVYKVAEFLERDSRSKPVLIGYDLIDQNIGQLEKGNINVLISQKPEVQSYRAIMALFEHLILKREVKETNYSAIDIIIKENLEYYKNSQ